MYGFRYYGYWIIGTPNERRTLTDVFTLEAIRYELKMWQDFDGPMLLADVIKSMSNRYWKRNNPAFKGTLLT